MSDEGAPLAGAEITVDKVDKQVAISRSDGRFELADLEVGRPVRLKVTLAGWHRDRRRNEPDWQSVFALPERQLRLVLRRDRLLRGSVLDNEGRPVAGARVTAVELSETGMIIFGFDDTTRADGAFSIGVPPIGDYSLHANADGFLPKRARRILTGGPSEPTPTVFTLERGTRLLGRVLDPKGEPQGDASVLAMHPHASFERLEGADDQGRYVFGSLPLGKATLIPMIGGRYGVPRQVVLSGAENEVDLVIERAAVPLRIRVVGPDGDPADGTRAMFWSDLGAFGMLEAGTLGELELLTFPGESLELQFCLTETGASAFLVARIDEPWPRPIEVQLRAPAQLRGRLVDAHGAPLQGLVSASGPPKTACFADPEEIRTDSEGTFRFENLEAGLWELDTSSPGRLLAPKFVWLDPGAEADVTVMEPIDTFEISGRVTGEEAHGGRIQAQGIDVVDEASSDIDASGRFELGPLRAGRYLVRVGFWREPLQTVEVVLSTDREIEIGLSERSLTLRGNVYEEGTGKPIANAALELRLANLGPLTYPSWDHDYPLAEARTDAFGRFAFRDLVADRYDLWVVARGFGVRRLLVTASSEADRLDVALAPEVRQVLYVRSASGSPQLLVTVEAFDPAGVLVTSQRSVARADGGIELRGLTAGAWELRIEDAINVAQSKLDVPSEPRHARLDAGGYLFVHVPDLTGRGLRLPVELIEKTGGRYKPMRSSQASEPVLLDGWARIGPIARGSWTVRVALAERLYEGQVEVAPGEDVVLELR